MSEHTEQTLSEWAAQQPYVLHTVEGAYYIADGAGLKHRACAWQLSDVLVSSITGGTIWFVARPDGRLL